MRVFLDDINQVKVVLDEVTGIVSASIYEATPTTIHYMGRVMEAISNAREYWRCDGRS